MFALLTVPRSSIIRSERQPGNGPAKIWWKDASVRGLRKKDRGGVGNCREAFRLSARTIFCELLGVWDIILGGAELRCVALRVRPNPSTASTVSVVKRLPRTCARKESTPSVIRLLHPSHESRRLCRPGTTTCIVPVAVAQAELGGVHPRRSRSFASLPSA